MFKTCHDKMHKYLSDYEKDKTPIKMFLKNPDDPTSEEYKNCLDCRVYKRKNKGVKSEEAQKKIDDKQKRLDDLKTMYQPCPSSRHKGLNTGYSKDKVPLLWFFKNPDDPDSIRYKNCCKCRKADTDACKLRTKNKLEKAKQEGKDYCSSCHTTKDNHEMAILLDGTKSKVCLDCKNKEKNRTIKLRKLYNDIKYEFIEQHGYSCERCEKILITSDDICQELDTFLLNGKRFLVFNEEEILVEEFLEKNRNLIELRMIQLDHLTEKEQRERGILGENEVFVGKKDNVSRMSSEEAMRNEAKKCQQLCGKCHLIITIQRRNKSKTGMKLEIQKKKIVLERKNNSEGCRYCGFFDPNLLEFLEFDHRDTNEKIDEVAALVNNNKITIDEFINEIEKCRILCKYCHIIRTFEQRGFMSYDELENNLSE